MTELRVLPVRKGNAYLLRSARGSYLFDGGPPGCAVAELLAERRVRRLRAAVCSSVTPGRLGGILELLRADHPVREFWLPEGLEVLPELARRFNGDLSGWLAAASDEGAVSGDPAVGWTKPEPGPDRRMQGAAALLALALAASQESWRDVLPPCGESDPPSIFIYILQRLARRAAARWGRESEPAWTMLWTLGCRLLEGGGPTDLACLCGRLMLDELNRGVPGVRRSLRPAIRVMVLAAMTAALADRDDAELRFFRPVERLADHLVARHPIKCLNGVESFPLQGLAPEAGPEAILGVASKMAAADGGLVFQYGEARCGALFCGDTRMGFLDRGHALRLDRPTAITAPGRGGCRTEQAYSHIQSDDPSADVWVRGFLPPSRKPSQAYQRLTNTLCLNDCRTQAFQEVLLRFERGAWRRLLSDCCA